MTGELRIRPMVFLPLRSHAALADHYLYDGNGGIFVPGYTNLYSGTVVDLEIAFAREQLSIYSHGVVRWRRASDTRRLPAGIGIELSRLDRRVRDLLRDFAAGRTANLVRRASRRFPVEIELDYSTARDRRLAGTTYDLSRSGAAIIGSRAPAVGTRLQIHIAPPNTPELNVAGEVRWWRSADRNLFGVRFLLDDKKVARRVQQLIDRVKQELADKPTG
jgi:Tfp pilus assembly protein PilZ